MDWAPWSACVGDCAFTLGNKNRTRGCEVRHPPFGGDGCPGLPDEEVQCDPTYGSQDCPISMLHLLIVCNFFQHSADEGSANVLVFTFNYRYKFVSIILV